MTFDGEDVTSRVDELSDREGNGDRAREPRLFGPMTVLENLQMGAYLHGGGDPEDYERVYTLFPLAPRAA